MSYHKNTFRDNSYKAAAAELDSKAEQAFTGFGVRVLFAIIFLLMENPIGASIIGVWALIKLAHRIGEWNAIENQYK